jgi:hypothetical protein
MKKEIIIDICDIQIDRSQKLIVKLILPVNTMDNCYECS